MNITGVENMIDSDIGYHINIERHCTGNIGLQWPQINGLVSYSSWRPGKDSRNSAIKD